MTFFEYMEILLEVVAETPWYVWILEALALGVLFAVLYVALFWGLALDPHLGAWYYTPHLVTGEIV